MKKISFKDIDEKLTDYTAETISKIRVTKEAQEGLSAFLEKESQPGEKMLPKKVNIYEVGARDGLQNEKIKLSLEKELNLLIF